MPTKLPRLNIVLEPNILYLVQQLARRDEQSMSFKARQLILEALELYEDYGLTQMVNEREAKNKSIPWVSHRKIWKK